MARRLREIEDEIEPVAPARWRPSVWELGALLLQLGAIAAILIPAVPRFLIAPLVALAALATGAALVKRHLRQRATDAERNDAQAPLLTAAGLLGSYEASGAGWFWETDRDGTLSYVTPQLEARLGLAPGAMIGQPLGALIAEEVRAAGEAAEQTVALHLHGRLPFADVAVRAQGDEIVWWLLSGRPAFHESGHFAGFRGSGVDLTEARRAEAEVTRAARYDALTGLPNRRLMRETLEAALRPPGGKHVSPCALLLLDLDRFKSVNDTLGHPVGDALLQLVAQRLAHVVDESGRVGRLGGDEFNVVVPDARDKEALASLADAIIARLSLPYTISGSTISIGASVGIAISPLDGDCPDELARNADLALYAAKAAGKGVHRFYQPQMHAEADDRRLLECDLREVLSGNELHLLYQPIIDTATNRIVAFEALARWDHPVRGLISPHEFIPIAEEIGLIPRIGEWVLRTACADAASWPEEIRLAVNVSPLQFASPGLPALVLSALATAGLPPERLELELTESVFLGESQTIDSMFAALDALGVRFALDDFGTGYASLANLKRGPFNKIKIDQSFVRDATGEDGRDAAIIRSIVALARELDMETTAEGAETPEDVELIRALGCSQIQGYLCGKPMTAAEARARAGEMCGVADEHVDREPRRAVLRFATLHSDGRSYPARIRNLSPGGAMIEIDPAARLSESVSIEVNENQQVAGDLRWTRQDQAGIRFAERIDVDQVMATPGVSRWRKSADDAEDDQTRAA